MGARRWQATLFDHGWMIPAYPPELGGHNATPVQTLVYLEEMARRRIPRSLHFPGLRDRCRRACSSTATTSRSELVPSAIRGDTIWCIGMSEPNAGSDLAGLPTAPFLDGDHFVVNGQKFWTSYAMSHRSASCTCALIPTPEAQGDQPAHRRHGHTGHRHPPAAAISAAPRTSPRAFFTDVDVPGRTSSAS